MNNPILRAFGAETLAEGCDPAKHVIRVYRDGYMVGAVYPERTGYHEMAYAYPGMRSIGPAVSHDTMKARLIRVMFAGDANAFERAEVKRELRF